MNISDFGRNAVWEEFFADFIVSDQKAVLYDEYYDYDSACRVANCAANYLRKHPNVPAKICRRGKKVYVVRKEAYASIREKIPPKVRTVPRENSRPANKHKKLIDEFISSCRKRMDVTMRMIDHPFESAYQLLRYAAKQHGRGAVKCCKSRKNLYLERTDI